MGNGESFDTPNPMAVEFAFEERRDERPTKLFQRGYTRKKKNATIIPSPSFNTPLDDTSMSSDDSSETNLKVYVLSPLTSKIATLTPQDGEQGRSYPLRDRKEPNRLGFS